VTEDAFAQNQEPGLRHYFDVVRRRFWIILAVLAACVGAAVAVTALQDNVYRATTKLVVGQGGGLPQVQYGNEVQTFTATMSELVRSNVVAENVIGNLRLADETPESLLSRMTTSINPQTAVITVSVEDGDQQRAARIAQEIALVFSQLVRERFASQTPDGAAPSEPPTVAIFDPAHALPYRVSPRPVRNVAAAILLGLILGLVAAFLREHFDRAIRTREDVERAFGVSVIGQVPFVRLRRGARGGVTSTESGPVAEAFRALRANLQYLGVRRPLQTLLVTSAAPEQGKTTITANLAVAIARSGASVAVVEGDLRRPRLDEAFGVDAGPGLTNVLVGAAELDAAIRPASVPGDASGGGAGEIALLPSGPLPPNPAELLSSFQMREVLDRLSQRYDYVLIDSPPLLAVADALELARMVDGVVLAVRQSRARTDDARELRSIVERLEVNVVGAVLTDVEAGAGYGYEPDARRDRVDGAPLLTRRRPEPEPVAPEDR
jgi:capsular exopolysaccharide synthesis family protein